MEAQVPKDQWYVKISNLNVLFPVRDWDTQKSEGN